jgi:hypothetical protein
VPLPGASSIWDESSCVVDIDEIDEVDLTGESKSSAALAAMHQEDLQQIRTVLEGAGWTANDLPSGIAQVLTMSACTSDDQIKAYLEASIDPSIPSTQIQKRSQRFPDPFNIVLVSCLSTRDRFYAPRFIALCADRLWITLRVVGGVHGFQNYQIWLVPLEAHLDKASRVLKPAKYVHTTAMLLDQDIWDAMREAQMNDPAAAKQAVLENNVDRAELQQLRMQSMEPAMMNADDSDGSTVAISADTDEDMGPPAAVPPDLTCSMTTRARAAAADSNSHIEPSPEPEHESETESDPERSDDDVAPEKFECSVSGCPKSFTSQRGSVLILHGIRGCHSHPAPISLYPREVAPNNNMRVTCAPDPSNPKKVLPNIQGFISGRCGCHDRLRFRNRDHFRMQMARLIANTLLQATTQSLKKKYQQVSLLRKTISKCSKRYSIARRRSSER